MPTYGELLAIVAVIRHFRYMLERRGFMVFMDHLVGALHRRFDPVSARQQHHLSLITEFTPAICHITGESNIVGDTVSQPASTSLQPASLTPGGFIAACRDPGTTGSKVD
jgi:hypothetical protein